MFFYFQVSSLADPMYVNANSGHSDQAAAAPIQCREFKSRGLDYSTGENVKAKTKISNSWYAYEFQF